MIRFKEKVKAPNIFIISITVYLFLILILTFLGSEIYAKSQNEDTNLDITAKTVCLLDSESGRILYQINDQTPKPVASTTKIMTAFLTLSNSTITDIITVSDLAAEVEGSSLYLSSGEKLTVKELLYGLMLDSGNDAAHVLAEHIASSTDDFADKMTEKAKLLGAKNTQFQNPHGLPDSDHYSSAYDMTLIANKALQNPLFAKIVSTQTYQIPRTNKYEETRYLKNDNKLLHKHDFITGVKTGWTEKAGRCLVFSGVKNDKQLIGTVLNAPEMYQDAELLFDYVTDRYNYYNLCKDEFVYFLPIQSGTEDLLPIGLRDDLSIPLTEDEKSKINFLLSPKENITAPITDGQQIGVLKFAVSDQIIYKSDLIAKKSVNIPFYKRILPWHWRN